MMLQAYTTRMTLWDLETEVWSHWRCHHTAFREFSAQKVERVFKERLQVYSNDEQGTRAVASPPGIVWLRKEAYRCGVVECALFTQFTV
jgi:hypothetical protein